ncbi:hypothetical protein H2200_011598 [Cladophialophora chaetospira]|uniref:Uncharacterized protein n=1 Tax=Cladophialophora chaetospira TaxID=386627 RepID=A0AA38WZM7_9EURO|nr:hypothetical protein H2200_011598 [Cladophialophora chaetospira]
MSASDMFTPNNRDNSQINTTTGRPRGRVQCAHPGCGKFGHTREMCWIAHPELRPNNRRFGRRSGPRRADGREGAGVSQSVAATASRPFRFLALPSEIRNRIYEFAFCEGYTLTVLEEHNTGNYIRTPEGFLHEIVRVHFSARPASDLHLVNKQIHQESRFATPWSRDKFGGHLVCLLGPHQNSTPYFNTDVFNGADSYMELRNKVTKLTYPDFTVSKLWGEHFSPSVSHMMDAIFPNVKEIRFHLSEQRCMYKDDSSRYTFRAWNLFRPGGIRAFLQKETEIDDDFRGGAQKIRLWHLRSRMHRAGIKCKIVYTETLEWCLNDGTPMFAQSARDWTMGP